MTATEEKPNPTIEAIEWMKENGYAWTKTSERRALSYNLFFITERGVTFITKERSLRALIKYVRVVIMKVDPE